MLAGIIAGIAFTIGAYIVLNIPPERSTMLAGTIAGIAFTIGAYIVLVSAP